MWKAVVSQPMDRGVSIASKGDIDHEAGEFWVDNPFKIVSQGNNLSAYETNRLFLSVKGDHFIDVSFASKTDIDSDSRSAIVADFNHDQRDDLLVSNVGGGSLRLFLNEFPQTGHFLRVNLVGSKSNRQGIGARIEAEFSGRKAVREVFAPMGFMGQSPPELLIGTGEANEIDVLTVRWPSGTVQQFSNVKTDQEVTIHEGEEKLAFVE